MAVQDKFVVKILVLDGERLIRMAICARLKKAGYDPVSVGSVQEAVTILKWHHRSFNAIISDIMLGDMDGFMFRDIVRGFDESIPFFFMTALDPEEGSGFLKKILADPMCYYLPKSAGTEVLMKRLQRVIGARRIQQFVENQVVEQRKSLALAAHVQRSMLSVRAMMGEGGFYTTWWCPQESVSGDLYEAILLPDGRRLVLLGDIQGHGTNAALVMMAVQVFLRQAVSAHVRDSRPLTPDLIANQLQEFFRASFADVSYMTAFVCIHDLPESDREQPSVLSYICCGAADPVFIDTQAKSCRTANPDKRGGIPVGLMPGTVYTAGDVVTVDLSPSTVCVVGTDGQQDISQDVEGAEKIPPKLLEQIGQEIVVDAAANGAIMVAPAKFMAACAEFGYDKRQDDVTVLIFGARMPHKGIYEATTLLSPTLVDVAAQEMGEWCAREGWPEELTGRVQLVLEESLMNVYDHGFTELQRRKDVVSLRLRRKLEHAELTVWDYGRPPPSLKVAAGVTETALALVNKDMGGHGRGRLMMRQLCDGIQRQRYGTLNETIFHIPWDGLKQGHETGDSK